MGDESAVPAALAIIEQTGARLPTVAYLEVPQHDDILEIKSTPETNLTWLPRADPLAVSGMLALTTAATAEFPAGRPSVFIAGESALATGLRRQLVSTRGITKDDISFFGYWRHGRASLG